MAHMTDGHGPYPDKAGEFCGNWLPGPENFPAMRLCEEPQEEADRHQREWLARMRFGRPAGCGAGSSEKMTSCGYVGLYLKEDRELYDWETPVDTDTLTEDRVSRDGAPGTRADATQ